MKTPTGPDHEAPQSTKDRILAVAEGVFAQRGFAGASTREIAAKAEVNISSLHYHWESKERLYFGVLQNIYRRILDVMGRTIPARLDRADGREVIEQSMGGLFDFFADNPNIPKLLVRRMLENEDEPVAIDADVLAPAWRQFAEWVRVAGGASRDEFDAELFMATLQNVVLLLLIDSRQYVNLLGGNLRQSEVRARVRRYLIDLVPLLLSGDRRPPKADSSYLSDLPDGPDVPQEPH